MNRYRQARPDDSAAIKRLVAHTLRTCVFANDDDGFDMIYNDICTVLDAWAVDPGDGAHWVCEHDQVIVGEILVPGYQKVHSFFVHPEHQRQGIGKALMDRALEACRTAGRSRRVVLNSSTFAAPFYREYGFREDGDPQDLPGGYVPFAVDL